MFDFLWVVLFVVLFIRIGNLSDRIRRLEKGISSVKSAASVAPASAPTPGTASSQVLGVPAEKPAYTPEPVPPSAFSVWIKENWLSKLGVLLILVGFGWFISYAFVHNWIGPLGRVSLGLFVGAFLCALGALRMRKDEVQANVLLVLGSALVLITVYASRVVYDYFTPGSSLGLSALVAAYIATVALMYNRERLAVYGVLIALIAPLFTHAPDPSVIGLYLYLGVVCIASVWLAVKRGWISVNAAALTGVFLYTVPFMFGASLGESEKVAVVLILSLLSLIFFVVNVLTVVRAQQLFERAAVFIAVLNAIIILGVIRTLVIEEVQSLLLAGWMIIFAAGSLYVSAYLKKQTFFYMYGLIAVLFLGVATAIELSGPVLTVAFMLEAAIVVLLTFVATKQLTKTAGMSIVLVIPALLSLESLDGGRWGTSIAHQDSAVVLLFTVILFVLGFFILHRYNAAAHPQGVRSAYVTVLSAAGAYAFAYVWLATHALLPDDVGTILSLACYTVVGIVSYIQGALMHRIALKWFGSVVLVLVILRLIFIDVWQMPLAPRIVTFMLIGVLLVSTAFIGRNKKQHENTVTETIARG